MDDEEADQSQSTAYILFGWATPLEEEPLHEVLFLEQAADYPKHLTFFIIKLLPESHSKWIR